MIEFAPTCLRASVAAAKVQHPYPGHGEIPRGDRANVDAGRLWTLLFGLRGQDLDIRVARLTAHEVRLASYGARGRLKDGEVLRVLARLFDLGQGRSQAALAFDAFIMSGGLREFHHGAEQHVGTCGPSSGLEAVLAASRPIKGLATAFKKTGERLVEWLKRPTAARLGTEVREALTIVLLSDGELPTTVQREGPAAVLLMVRTYLDSNAQAAWFRAYLSHGGAVGWALGDPVLTEIVQEFQQPNDQSSFWKLVDPAARDAVSDWLKETDLHLLLGDAERVKFWKRFLRELDHTEVSQDRNAVFIVFPKWYACQFKQSGVATYCFPISDLREMKRLSGTSLVQAARTWNPLGRYEHRGFLWRSRAEWEVRRVMRESSR